jgi:molecular chaperone DnaK (HSP70)
MKITNLLAAVVVSAGLGFSATAWAAEEMGEVVDLNSLPAAVQKTIKEKAAGGEIVRVKREDDANGRWNYEAVIKKDGKEWGLEVAPSGKFLKKHNEKKEKD